jgi:hypothetical protein
MVARKKLVDENRISAETIVERFMKIVGINKQEQVPAAMDDLLKNFAMQKIALEHMGLVSAIVVPGGLFQFMVSPNLISTMDGLDSLDKALEDLRNTSVKYRKQLMEKEIQRRTQEALAEKKPPEDEAK